MTNKQYMLLYSSNFLVEGKHSGAIYCLEKGMIARIPLSLCYVVKQLQKKPFADVRESYRNQLDVFDSYITFLLDHKMAFFTCSPENFPPPAVEFDLPELISQATIRLNHFIHFRRIIDELNSCHCKHLVVFLTADLSNITSAIHILRETEHSSLRTIDFIFEKNCQCTSSDLAFLSHSFPKLLSVTVCECPENDGAYINDIQVNKLSVDISSFIRESFKINLLVLNHRFFFESQSHQPFFNKKVYISEKGDVKNWILQKRSFGNIATSKLEDIVRSAAFQRLWKHIPPAIKHSEFRYCVYTPDDHVDLSTFQNCHFISYNTIPSPDLSKASI